MKSTALGGSPYVDWIPAFAGITDKYLQNPEQLFSSKIFILKPRPVFLRRHTQLPLKRAAHLFLALESALPCDFLEA